MTHTPAPITAAERHEILDALRGLALFGIFVMNLRALAGWYAMGPDLRAAVLMNPADRTLLFLHDLLLHGKFYTLFSLLFGIGFALQLGRAGGPDFLARYRRRLAILLGLGMIHMTFLWEGDILAAYALCGFALLPFRQLGDRRLLAWAAFFIVLPVAWYALMLVTGFDPVRKLEGVADTLWVAASYEDVDPLVVLGQGTLADILRWNVFGPFYRFGS